MGAIGGKILASGGDWLAWRSAAGRRQFVSLSPGLVICMMLLSGGCFYSSGPSSGDIKKQLTDSFLFKSSYVYFPNDTIADSGPSFPTLSSAQIRDTSKEVTAFVDALSKQHEKCKDALSKALGRPLGSARGLRVDVTDWNQPVAQTTHEGVIQIDIKVLQAVFRSATALALSKGASIDNPLGGSSFTPPPLSLEELESGQLSEATQIKTLLAFLDIRRRVRTTPGHSAFGDAFSVVGAISSQDLKSVDWLQLAPLAVDSTTVQNDYLASLLFLLAHEQGHVVLGHFKPNAVTTPADRHQAELDADTYALCLMATFAQGASSPFSDAFKDSLGYSAFFAYAYTIAGYEGLELTDKQGYPTRKERLANLDALFDKFDSARQDALNKAILDAEAKQKGHS